MLGDPADPATSLGPVAGAGAVERFDAAVAEARRDGTVVAGGERDGGFVAPTLVTGLPRGHRLTREELFLPFLTVTPVDSLDDALEEANAVEYGLTAGIFSADDAEVEAFLDRIEAGVVYVNRRAGATTGAWPGIQTFCGWKASGASGKGGLGPHYVHAVHARAEPDGASGPEQQAGRAVLVPRRRQQRRVLAVARLEAMRAARVQPAARRDVRGVGRLAAQQPRAALAPRRRHGGDQRLRVRVARVLDHLRRAALLDDPAEVHDRDPVAQGPGQAEVVGDEQQRQRARVAQVHQHLQDLRADRDVEHRDRLVADQRVGVEHERRGDRHALALAAGQLVREAVGEAPRRQADVRPARGRRARRPARRG